MFTRAIIIRSICDRHFTSGFLSLCDRTKCLLTDNNVMLIDQSVRLNCGSSNIELSKAGTTTCRMVVRIDKTAIKEITVLSIIFQRITTSQKRWAIRRHIDCCIGYRAHGQLLSQVNQSHYR